MNIQWILNKGKFPQISRICCIAVIQLYVYNVYYTYIFINKINNNDERTHFFRKIYLSHFFRNGCESVAKESCVRGESKTEQTATYWPPVPLSLEALLSRSAGLLNQGSWGPIALCWVLVLSTASYLQLSEPVSGTGLYNSCGFLGGVTSAPNSTRPQSSLYPDIFDRMNLLFTQVHFLFDSSADAQYVTYSSVWSSRSMPYTRWRGLFL